MTDAKDTTDPVIVLMQRLLAGPDRPGQTFTMPGTNYDGLYRLARRFKAVFAEDGDGSPPVCMGTDDRSVLAAAMLATLAGGPQLLIPDDLSVAAFAELHRLTGFNRFIGRTTQPLPPSMTVIDPEQPDQTVDDVETLASEDAPDPEHTWIRLFTGAATQSPRLWSKTPRNLLGEVLYLKTRFGIGSGDRILATFPAMTIYGLIHSLLLPLAASARVVAQTPTTAESIKHLLADASPTILVSTPAHYGELKDNPPGKGALRLACCATGPLVKDHGLTFSGATGVELVEVYGSPSTGGIATRCREKGEAGFRPYECIQWRVAGHSLDIRSDFLSAELPVRDSGWFTVADRVKSQGSEGFVITDPEDDIARQNADLSEPATASHSDQGIEDTGTTSGHQSITFEPAGLKVPLDETKTLQELGAGHSIDIRADCGGMGICGKCRVLAHPRENFSALTDAELDVLTPDQMADRCRLACQARAVGQGTVTIPDTLTESAETRGKTDITGSYPVDASIRRLTVTGRSPGLKTDNTPESLVDWLAVQVGLPAAATADITSLRRLGRYRDSLKAFTLVLHEETGLRRILDGEQTTSLGFAVDLGTTSIAGYLCDLNSGVLLAVEACVNPQRRFGEDVISRISRINANDDHLEQFQRLSVEGINFLMARCLKQVGATSEAIDEVAVCGNTTMQQIFAGLHPRGLGISPYLPLTLIPPAISAGDLGLDIDPASPVFLMPVISGFVGGDTMAAILADRPHERDDITLIVDIGTNGEVVLGNREQLWVTSCATGPALEGAQISSGMRAVSGAIHRAWAEEGRNRMAYDILGNKGSHRPMGICGSGVIDAIAALRQMGVVLTNGRLKEEKAGVTSDQKGVGQRYTIAGSDQSATGADIAITLKDVRQIQLAKGALSTGIEFLMRKAGIENIDRTILTGAFGARFNWRNALAIGMLPPAVAQGEVIPRDNLAGVGVVMALLDKKLRLEARELCRRIRYLELASEPDFAMAFARATTFPEIV